MLILVETKPLLLTQKANKYHTIDELAITNEMFAMFIFQQNQIL